MSAKNKLIERKLPSGQTIWVCIPRDLSLADAKGVVAGLIAIARKYAADSLLESK